MASFAPRFCQVHLKIHVCNDIEIASQVKQRTELISAKVRKLTGTQTEEEKKQLEEKRNRAMKIDGTLSAILARAKQKNEDDKSHNPVSSNEENTAVSEDSLADRIAALRNKMSGGGSSTKINRNISKSSIQNIIDDARTNIEVVKEESDEELKKLDNELNNKKAFKININSKKDLKKIDKKEEKLKIKQNNRVTNNNLEKTYTEEEVQKLIAEAVEYTLKKHKNS